MKPQRDGSVHIWPDADLIAHDIDGPCVCGPDFEEHGNGCVLVTHHSIDGREQAE